MNSLYLRAAVVLWSLFVLELGRSARADERTSNGQSQNQATDAPGSKPGKRDANGSLANNPADPTDSAKTETGRILERTYEFKEAGKEMVYGLYIPKSYDDTKRAPLIVALHGLHSNPRQILGYPGFTSQAEERGYLLVAPMGYNTRGWYGSRGKRGGGRWDPENLGELSEKDVMNVLDLIRKEFRIDQERIYLYGHSMGGGGSLHLAMTYPDTWCAIALIAPAAFGPRERLERAKRIPAIIVQGDNDRLVPVRATRQWVEMMKKLQMRHRYIEVEGGGHVKVAWQHFEEIFDFFDTHANKKRVTVEAETADSK